MISPFGILTNRFGNTFSGVLSEICKASNVVKPYCMRTTAIQHLSDKGFRLNLQCTFMFSHKNESVLIPYIRFVSTKKVSDCNSCKDIPFVDSTVPPAMIKFFNFYFIGWSHYCTWLCMIGFIIFQKCPFEALSIINLPSNLEKDTTHRYSANSFKLHRSVISF